jgi:O-antigen/teichoic acid export membrane protein
VNATTLRLRNLRTYSARFAIRGLALTASALSALLTARMLPPAERGILALLTVPVTYVASFAGTGMRQPVAKSTEPDRDHSVTSGTMLVAVGIGLVSATVWCASRAGLVPALAGGALCTGMVLFAFVEALAISSGHITRILLAQLAVQSVFLVGAPLLYALAFASPVALVGMQFFAFAMVLLGAYHQELRGLVVLPTFSYRALAHSISHGAGTLALTLLCRLDVFAAVLMLPAAPLGQYVVAAAFGELLSQLPAFAGFLLFAETPRDAPRRRHRLYGTLLRALLVSSVAGGLLALVVPFIVRALLGSEYYVASRIFIWLLPAYVLGSAVRVTAGFIAAIGDTRLLLGASLAGAATMTGLVIATGPARVSSGHIAGFAAAAEAGAVAVLLFATLRSSRYD